MTTQLETYIPLEDAARKYGVPVEAFRDAGGDRRISDLYHDVRGYEEGLAH